MTPKSSSKKSMLKLEPSSHSGIKQICDKKRGKPLSTLATSYGSVASGSSSLSVSLPDSRSASPSFSTGLSLRTLEENVAYDVGTLPPCYSACKHQQHQQRKRKSVRFADGIVTETIPAPPQHQYQLGEEEKQHEREQLILAFRNAVKKEHLSFDSTNPLPTRWTSFGFMRSWVACCFCMVALSENKLGFLLDQY